MMSWHAAPRAALAVTLLGLAGYAAARPAETDGRTRQADFEWSEAMEPGSTLRVHTVAGTVTVRRAPGRAARVRGDTEAGRDPIRYVTGRGGGGVRICALSERAECGDDGIRGHGRGVSRGRGRRSKASFTVEVPAGVVVRVSSGNGDVSVDGATADVHASSGNGAVRVGAGAARVAASTGNGEVRVERVRGPVDASTGNGKITVSTAAGPVEASTGNGSIDVSMASLRGAGGMDFSSGNGSITLHLPSGFGAEVDARTGNGSIVSEFPVRVHGRPRRHRLRATLGDGGPRLHASTGNGSIHLRRLAD